MQHANTSSGLSKGGVRHTTTSRVSRGAQPELATDDCAKGVGDLAMPGNRSLSSIGGVSVGIVSIAVAVQDASVRFQLSHQIPPLHTSNSTSRRLADAGAGLRS